ncbi:MAG: ROK family protein [Phycisphaerales bacterium]
MTAPAPSTVIGVDLGGTNLNVSLLATDGPPEDAGLRPLARRHAETAIGDPAAVVETIAECVVAVRAEAGEAAAGAEREQSAARTRNAGTPDVPPIGIAAAGALDVAGGTVLQSPNLQWRDVPLRSMLAKRTGLPVTMENDVNAAAYGEFVAGGPDAGDLLAVWVGTGVGGGIVIDGQPFHGARGTAGEVGHMIARPNAPGGARAIEHLCGRRGLQRRVREAAAEHPASPLVRRAAEEPDRAPNAADFKAAAAAGDALALALQADAALLLGSAISSCVTVLSVQRVVIGGGMTEAWDQAWVDAIAGHFRDMVFPEHLADVPVEMTRLRERAGVYGAAALAVEVARRGAAARGGAMDSGG